MATVFVTPDARRQAAELPKPIRARIGKAVERLKDWPSVSGCKALSGNLAGWHRMRVGDYRIRFRAQGETVTVDKIGHRKDVYDD
jgi:mRNA interferase RelE/StbE